MNNIKILFYSKIMEKFETTEKIRIERFTEHKLKSITIIRINNGFAANTCRIS